MLLSGHHARIAAWRLAEAERITCERRPDMWARYVARTMEASVTRRRDDGLPPYDAEDDEP